MPLLDKPVKAATKFGALADALCNEFTLEELRVLFKNLQGSKPATSKGQVSSELAAVLFQHLKKVYEKLTNLEQLAVADGLHLDSGYNPQRFAANHGQTVEFGTRSSYHAKPSLLRIFLENNGDGVYFARRSLREKLLTFVSRSETKGLQVEQTLPAYHEFKTTRQEWQEGDKGGTLSMRGNIYHIPLKEPKKVVTIEQAPIQTALRAEAAQQELWAVLKLVQEGKVNVAEKSRQPASDNMYTISRCLGQDFYQDFELDDFKEVSFIRSFAWPMLLQASGLAVATGKKLALTKRGHAALAVEPAQTLKMIWQAWIESDFFDEFRRIDCVKGQTGKGQRSFTDASERRKQIAKTLLACPPNSWIESDEFSRYMRAVGNSFEVTYDAWPLYVGDSNYGSLGYSSSSTWEILQDRYLFCFLFEYAATIGLIDVAFVAPWRAHQNFLHMWGTDQLPFFSRYDGLVYFKVNDLGAFCLDQISAYRKSSSECVALTVRPNMRIELRGGSMAMSDVLIIESFAERLENGAWELSQEKSLLACEQGQTIDDLRKLFERLDDQPLPQQVEKFLLLIEKRASAVRTLGKAVLFECADAKSAKEIATHSLTRKLCILAGNNILVVRDNDEPKFRKSMRILGYGTSE